jgi:hypothetical protein
VGHSFCLFTVPELDETWAYDVSAPFWHQRAFWDTTTGVFKAYRPGCMMSAFGKTIVGDRITGTLYEMTIAVHTDVDGAVIRRVRQPPRFSVQQKRVTVHSLQVILDTGLGLNTGQGSDPVLMLQTSKDGGKTFGNERREVAGKMGAWDTRVMFDRCGQARNRVDRFVATDPIPWRIVDCEMTFTVGLH